MAKKKVTVEPIFTVVMSGLVAISRLYPARFANASRDMVANLLGLLGLKVSKEGKVTVNKETSAILNSMMSARGWDATEKVITSTVGVNEKARPGEARLLTKEHAANLDELQTLQLWSGEKGKFNYYKAEEAVELTHDDLVAEWNLTFPMEVEGVNRFLHPECEIIVSANRRVTILVIRNAIVRKAGFPEDVITHIEREKRAYPTEGQRNDDSVYLNEAAKSGKLETTQGQKLGFTFKKLASGAIQKDLEDIFAANDPGARGKVQLFWAVVILVRFVAWSVKVTYKGNEMTGPEAAALFETELKDGTIPMPKQGKQLKRINETINTCRHSDGHEAQFALAGPEDKRKAYGVRPSTKLNIAEQKKHVRAHPELTQGIADYFANLQVEGWVDPMIGTAAASASSLASTEIAAIATQTEGLLETLLNTCAGLDTGESLVDVVRALQEQIKALVEPLYFSDPETGELLVELGPVTQADFALVESKLSKKALGVLIGTVTEARSA